MDLRWLGAAGLAVVLAISGAVGAEAQEREVRLSPIEMVESKNTIDHITQVDMERKTATNLWEAMKGVLGVYEMPSSNSEGLVGIRGLGRERVGLFIDDIPISTAWRSVADLNNTLLYDLESIEVSKGYSSPLLASNSGLGGVLNLRTAKPTKELEFTAKYMNFFDRKFDDQGRFFGTSIGTKQEQFYLKATVMLDQRDFFTLPSSFTPGPGSNDETGGRRTNSDSKNKAVNLMAGWTPTEDVDIMFGFVRQSRERGMPIDASHNAYEKDPVFRRYPEIETTRYYVNANANMNEKARLKAVLYRDEYKDSSSSYTDKSFSTPSYANERSLVSQDYDDSTSGGQLTFDYTFNEANRLAVSAGYRQESHKSIQHFPPMGTSNYPGSTSLKGREPNRRITEDYWDFGAEYTLKPFDPLTLVFGVSHSRLTPKTSELRVERNINGVMTPYDAGGSKNLFNYQVGTFYDLTENHEIFLTFAKKSRFATMQQRYSSTNDGKSTNPDLKPEHAFHYEVGYRGLINDWLKLNSSLYYSDVTDMIASVNKDICGDFDRCYRNIDKTDFFGLELGGEALVNQHLSAGLTFNYLKWNTDTSDRAQSNLRNLPKITSTAYAVVSPLEGLSIIPQVNMSSGFYWNTNPDASSYKETGGFATADLKVVYDFNEHLTFELGAKNLFDKEYAYNAYYPEPGRNFFLGLTGRY